MSDLPQWAETAARVLAAYERYGVHDFILVVSTDGRLVVPKSPLLPRRSAIPVWCVQTALRLSSLRAHGAYEFSVVICEGAAPMLLVKNPHQPYKLEALARVPNG